MRERAVEPVFAVLQLGEMPRRVSGFALGRSDALPLRMLGCLDLLEVEVEREATMICAKPRDSIVYGFR